MPPLLSIRPQGGIGVAGLGVTLIDALSTLRLMGLDAEFAEGAAWVASHLDFDTPRDASFFELVIRVLGGLASAHDLSGDPALAAAALNLADRLLPAFDASPVGARAGGRVVGVPLPSGAAHCCSAAREHWPQTRAPTTSLRRPDRRRGDLPALLTHRQRPPQRDTQRGALKCARI